MQEFGDAVGLAGLLVASGSSYVAGLAIQVAKEGLKQYKRAALPTAGGMKKVARQSQETTLFHSFPSSRRTPVDHCVTLLHLFIHSFMMQSVNMRALWALAPLLAPAVNALPAASSTPGASSTPSPSSGGSAAAITGNPFAGHQQYVNPYYKSEVENLAIPSMTGDLAAQASAAADVPSFVWL